MTRTWLTSDRASYFGGGGDASVVELLLLAAIATTTAIMARPINAPQPNGAAAQMSTDARAITACMTQGFAALQQSIQDLVAALGTPATTTHP